MKTQRGGIGALMLYLTAQTGAAFVPTVATAADAAVKATPQAQAPAVTKLVLADASWDAFVFVSAAAAMALEIAAADQPVGLDSASWFQAPEPQFDYLAALSDVGIAAPQAETPQLESHWLA
jgi:hypothetical protein